MMLVSLALGSPVAEPNWKLWLVISIFVGLPVAYLIGWVLYSWWLRRMKAGIALIFSYIMMALLAIMASMFIFIQFVGPVLTPVFVPTVAVVAIIFIAALFMKRKTAK